MKHDIFPDASKCTKTDTLLDTLKLAPQSLRLHEIHYRYVSSDSYDRSSVRDRKFAPGIRSKLSTLWDLRG